MIRSIPIKDLEKLANEWERWANKKMEEYKESPCDATFRNTAVAFGVIDCSIELRNLIRNISTNS